MQIKLFLENVILFVKSAILNRHARTFKNCQQNMYVHASLITQG